MAGSMPAGWTQMGALTTRNWAAEKGQRGPPKGRLVPESGHVLGGLRVSGIGRRGGGGGGWVGGCVPLGGLYFIHGDNRALEFTL